MAAEDAFNPVTAATATRAAFVEFCARKDPSSAAVAVAKAISDFKESGGRATEARVAIQAVCSPALAVNAGM